MAFQIPVINTLIQCYVQQNGHKLHVSFESKSTVALIDFSWQKDVPVKCRTLKKLHLCGEKVLCHNTNFDWSFLAASSTAATFSFCTQFKIKPCFLFPWGVLPLPCLYHSFISETEMGCGLGQVLSPLAIAAGPPLANTVLLLGGDAYLLFWLSAANSSPSPFLSGEHRSDFLHSGAKDPCWG